MVSYMSLATAGGLVQLGLVVSFQRVVAVREGRVMCGVVASCIAATTVHLALEASICHKMGLLHVGQLPGFVWLSEGKFVPRPPNTAGTGVLLIPHLIFLLITKLAVTACKLRDRYPCPRNRLSRYRLALATSGANGRLTWSAFIVLALVLLGVVVIVPLFPAIFNQLDPADSNTLTFRSILGMTFAFWVGCGSFLVDTEPRQFILRRLGRAWAGWRAGRAGAERSTGRSRRPDWSRRCRPRVSVSDHREVEIVELTETSRSRVQARIEAKEDVSGSENSLTPVEFTGTSSCVFQTPHQPDPRPGPCRLTTGRRVRVRSAAVEYPLPIIEEFED